ncbi:snaclec A8-like [Branchiostoma floridae x Branchiostoma japonicum]
MRLEKGTSVGAVFVFLTLIVGVLLSSPPDVDNGSLLDPCWPDWQRHDSSCFKLFTDADTFYSTKTKCRENGATLAMAKDEPTNEFILSLKGSNVEAWIGLRRGKNYNWTWIDGTRLNESFQAWAIGEPNNNNSRYERVCVHLGLSTSQNVWMDTYCGRNYSYICQKDLCIAA